MSLAGLRRGSATAAPRQLMQVRWSLLAALGCLLVGPCQGIRTNSFEAATLPGSLHEDAEMDAGADSEESLEAMMLEERALANQAERKAQAHAAVEADEADEADHDEKWFGWFNKREPIRFSPKVIGQSFKTMSSCTPPADDPNGCAPQQCVAMLQAKVLISPSTWQTIKDQQEKPGAYLEDREVVGDPTVSSSSSKWLHAKNVSWWKELQEHDENVPAEALGVAGMRLLSVNGHMLTEGSWVEVLQNAKEEEFEMGFKAGLDLRGCWGNTLDDVNEPVCGDIALHALGQDLMDTASELSETDVNKPIVVETNLNFNVRTITESEANLLYTVVPQLGEKSADDASSCFQTSLAPICVVLQIPRQCDQAEDCVQMPDVFWSAQRKINLRNQEQSPALQLDGSADIIDSTALKGPKLASPAHSIGRFVGRQQWRQEDAGFMRLFPYGLHWLGCGSREAAHTLQFDAERLESMKMTNYVLSGRFYAAPSVNISNENCQCSKPGSSASPRWPLIIDACPGVADGSPQTICSSPVRVAFTITNWLEQTVDAWNPISTRRGPQFYRESWVRMWPQYFHLEPRTYEAAENRIKATDAQPAEELQKVQAENSGAGHIVALTKIKWRPSGLICGTACTFKQALPGSEQQEVFFRNQIEQVSSQHTASGSWGKKVIPGMRGQVVVIPFPAVEGETPEPDEGQTVGVVWDAPELRGPDSNEQYVFKVYLNQVMPTPRITQTEHVTTTPLSNEVSTSSFDFWDSRSGLSGPTSFVLALAAASILGML